MISIENEERPWGRFFVLHDEPTYKLKRIDFDTGVITLDGKGSEYTKGQILLSPQGVKHRIENKGLEKVVFIEAQTDSYFGEHDIVLIKDYFNRA
tara:strand:+ start:2083 stop:2367 length:285 start_codon:yes stop_codon:yes gene_type:complete